MKKLLYIVMALSIGVGILVFIPEVSHASPASEIKTGVTAIGGDDSATLESNFKTIVNILLYILGAIAVIMIVIGGVRYTTSNGDQSNVKAGKDIILYSVIGLIVAIMAYAIVNFVVAAFVPKA